MRPLSEATEIRGAIIALDQTCCLLCLDAIGTDRELFVSGNAPFHSSLCFAGGFAADGGKTFVAGGIVAHRFKSILIVILVVMSTRG